MIRKIKRSINLILCLSILMVNTQTVRANSGSNTIVTEDVPVNDEYQDYINSSGGGESEGLMPTGAMPAKYNEPIVDTQELYAMSDSTEAYPAKYVSNCITPVKNQYMSTCWAYSASAQLESALIKKYGVSQTSDVILEDHISGLGSQTIKLNTGSEYDISERHLRHATSNYNGNSLGYNRAPTGGGWNYIARTYWTRSQTNGSVYEADDPKEGNELSRAVAVTNSKPITDYYVTDTVQVGNYSNDINKINKIKQLVIDYGSVDLGSYKSNQSQLYNNYYKTIYVDGSTGEGYHAVQIVGWDDSFPIEYFNGNHENGADGAFIIKNSWGNGAGEHGFYYISYDCVSKLNSLSAISNIEDRDFYEKIYEYDELFTENKCFPTQISNNKKMAYYNIYSADNAEYLTAVSGVFPVGSYKVKVYYSATGEQEDFENIEISDRESSLLNGEHIYYLDDGGYKTFMLEEPIFINGGDFAVGFEVESLGVSAVNYYVETNNVQKGKSFIAQSIYDTGSRTSARTGDSGNLCIKAFTKSANKNWDFGNTKFDNYITQEDDNPTSNCRWIDGLGINANSQKYVVISNNSKSLNGFNYSRRLELEGMGNKAERSVNFEVFGNSKIYITLKSSSDEYRKVKVMTESGTVIGTIDATPELRSCKIDYTGGRNKIYLCSEDGDVFIYSLGVDTVESTQAVTVKDWIFSDQEFSSISSITSESTISGLTIIPNANIVSKKATIDGTAYTRCLNFSNSGSNTANCLKFYVPSDCYIQIAAKSNGTIQREISVVNEYGYAIGTIPASVQGAVTTLKYTGAGDNIYIRSNGGSVNIFRVSILTTGSETSLSYESRVSRGNRTGYSLLSNRMKTYAANENLAVEDSMVSMSAVAAILEDIVISDSGVIALGGDMNSNEISMYSLSASSVNSIDSNRYYYNQLNEDDIVNLYDDLYEKLVGYTKCQDNLKIEFDNLDCLDTAENRVNIRKKINSAVSAFMNDNPRAFWVDSYYYSFKTVTYNGTTWIYGVDIYVAKKGDCGATEQQTKVYLNVIESYINQIASSVNAGSYRFNSDYERALKLSEELGKRYTYNNTNAVINKDNMFGVFYEGKANSFGAAGAYKVLCDKLGIPCIYAEGYMGNESRAWNYVYLDENWYLTDVTNQELYMVSTPNNCEELNPSIYGDNSATVQLFGYPATDDMDYYKMGDVDLDGTVTSNDAAIIMQYVLNSSAVNLSVRQKLNADVSGDGILTADDSAIVYQMSLNGTGISLYDIVVYGVSAEEVGGAIPDENADGVVDIEDIAISMKMENRF